MKLESGSGSEWMLCIVETLMANTKYIEIWILNTKFLKGEDERAGPDLMRKIVGERKRRREEVGREKRRGRVISRSGDWIK